MNTSNPPTLLRLLARCLRLRCPGCGKGKLFAGWFSMHADCPECNRHHEREPGFFLGSIYFNYGTTSLLVTTAFFILYFAADIPRWKLLTALGIVSFLFPAWFFRYARSLWIAFDEYLDPWEKREGQVEDS